MRSSFDPREDIRSHEGQQSSASLERRAPDQARRAGLRLIVVLLLIGSAIAAVAASGMWSAEPVHTMPDGSTMESGTMRP
jgi:hypothetical protein